jgi:hypothetical protein
MKTALDMARYGDHGHQLKCDLTNEERVKEFYRVNGCNFELVLEEARRWSPGLPPMVPLLDIRTWNSFTLGGAPGSVAGIKRGGDDFLVKFEGESGHVVLTEYLDIFENAVKELERSVEGNNHRAFLTALSDGIASRRLQQLPGWPDRRAAVQRQRTREGFVRDQDQRMDTSAYGCQVRQKRRELEPSPRVTKNPERLPGASQNASIRHHLF